MSRSKYRNIPTVVDGVRFASKVASKSRRVGECLIWQGANIEGYPWMRWEGGGYRVTRLVLERKLGRPIRPSHLACHTCDTPSCIEAEHLFEATAADNRADMDRKGRARPARGERVATAKLSSADVAAIRDEVGTLKEIGARYGIHFGQVSKIRRGLAWRHI